MTVVARALGPVALPLATWLVSPASARVIELSATVSFEDAPGERYPTGLTLRI